MTRTQSVFAAVFTAAIVATAAAAVAQQAPFQLPFSGAGPRTPNAKMGDVISVMDFQSAQPGVLIGTGQDDSPAINAAITAAIKNGWPNGATVEFPRTPTGYYNICGASSFLNVHRLTPGDPTWSVTLRGASSGGGSTIRVKPGCATPPDYMLYVNVFATDDPKSTGRVRVTNMRFDGYNLSKYNLLVDYAVGLQVDNTVFRNVKGGSGNANVKVVAGYENTFASSVKIENVNDDGLSFYSDSDDLPDYNVYTTGNDSHYFIKSAIDAKIANFYQAHGGNNTFNAAHGWGYTNGGDGQPDLRPQYNFYIRGKATVIGSFADSATVAGIFLTPALDSGTDDSGAVVIGNTCYSGDGSPNCIQVAAGGKKNIIANNSTLGFPVVFDDATPDATNIVRDNAGSGLTSPLFLQGYKGTEQKLTLSNDTGNSYIAASNASGVGGDAATLKLSANGSGVIQAIVAGNTAWTASSSALALALPITTGVWNGTAIGPIYGGTGLTSYALGDILYSSATNTLAKLAGNTTTTRKFMRQTGSGSASAAPAWDTILAADIPGSAVTKTNDTNVTMTLGGSDSTGALNAFSMTLGWTGQLGYSRGGTNASTAWTQGSVLFAGASALAEDNSNLFWDATNHRLGIGTTSPQSPFHLYSSSSFAPVSRLQNDFNDANAGYFQFLKTRGGTAQAQVNDVLGNLQFLSRDTGGTIRTASSISAAVTAVDGSSVTASFDLTAGSTLAYRIASNKNRSYLPIQMKEYTVSGLPTCNSTYQYTMAVVTDATAPTYRGALTGSGAVVTPVFCDGSSWTSH